MKQVLFVLVLICCFLYTSGQEPIESNDYLDIADSTVYKRDETLKPVKKADFGVDVGMAYSFYPHGYGGYFFNLSPHVRYPVTKRFSASVGISMVYGSLYNPYYTESGENPLMPMTQMFITASVNYMVSERLIVSGSVYKQINDVQNPNPGQTQANYDSHGASVGMHYKLTPSISFGAQIRVDQPGLYYNPYSSVINPYNNSGLPNWW